MKSKALIIFSSLIILELLFYVVHQFVMGEPYINVGDKHKKPLLPNDSLNRDLLGILEQIKFISKFKIEKDGEKLRVYPTRTTYIF